MKTPMRLFLALSAIAVGLAACTGGDDRVVIQNKGSDTLVVVAQAWAEAYKGIDNTVAVAVSGGGSGTGASALINGTVDIANMSRSMKEKERKLAGSNGISPKEHIVGYDALAVYVHPDNPIKSISPKQLAEIYGEGGTIERWSQLGVTIPGGDDKIIRVSRQNNSGTYVYFKEATMGKKRDYKMGSLDMHGSKDVVEKVSSISSAIGYSGLAYANEHVRMVPIQTTGSDSVAVSPSIKTASNGSYPIARPLFMYTVGEPEGKVREYLDWIMSDAGQKILVEKGYAPIR